MTIPPQSDFRTLMEQHNDPCISMFLPIHRAGMETQQDRLRLRNHIRAAENRLLLDDLRSTQIEHLLQPMRALFEDEQFWLHPGDGLALFRSPDVFRTYWLPTSLKEQVVVTDHFYLKPLLPFIVDDERFYILALSQEERADGERPFFMGKGLALMMARSTSCATFNRSIMACITC